MTDILKFGMFTHVTWQYDYQPLSTDDSLLAYQRFAYWLNIIRETNYNSG